MTRVALVVGINTYNHFPDLQAPAHDAEAIAGRLSQDGEFKVFRLPEATTQTDGQYIPKIASRIAITQASLELALQQLFRPDSRQISDTALFYFSGHSLSDADGEDGLDKGYLATSDTDPNQRRSGISLAWLQNLLQRSPIRNQIVWLDCSHSGGLLIDFSAAKPAYSQRHNHCFIASCRDFEQSWQDLNSPYSVLTKALLDGLNPKRVTEGWIDTLSLVDYVNQALKGEQQTPMCDIFGDAIVLTRSSQFEKAAVGSSAEISNLIAQSFKNDTAEGKDLLGIESEVYALAEVLGMRALKPPLAVGILGGWGSGKSFVMQLMRQRLTQIYQDDISPDQAWGLEGNGTPSEAEPYPYVGHLYQICFNSWTYAKTDLWSSLMQTIFYELNYQLTLEKHLRDTFAVHAAVTQLFEQNSSLGTVEAFIQNLQEQTEAYSSRCIVLTPEYWQEAAEQVEQQATESPQKSTEWPGQSVEALKTVWESAKGKSYQRLLKGGAIWRIVSSELTAAERDEAIKTEPTLGPLGLLIWQEILAGTRNQGVIWQELSNLRQRDQRELTAIEQSLRSAEKELASQQTKAELTAQRQLAYRKATIIWQPVLNQAYRLLGVDPDLVSNWRQALQKFKKSSRTYVALGCLVALMVIRASPSWSDRMAAVSDIVDAYLNTVSIWLKDLYTHSWLAQVLSLPVLLALLPKVWAAAKDYMHQVQAAQAQLESDFQTYLHEAQEKANLQENLKTVEGLRLQAEQKRQQIGILADQASVLSFVNNRLQDDSYGRRLGLIHQISRDLEGLSQRLVCKEQDPNSETWQHIRELFPRGPARVILYIDDLDRCPPDRVVDVLEAVQLLLNTPLFVVVLAIDDRYIARALETAYKGVLKRRGTPSGIDYIEKIIQIPYRTRPITGKAIETYLENHIDLEPEDQFLVDKIIQRDALKKELHILKEEMDGKADPKRLKNLDKEVHLVDKQLHLYQEPRELQEFTEKILQVSTVKPPPPKVAHFTRAELDILKKHCREVDLSPRTAKRLINIYKILKILWFRSERDQQPNADIIQEAVLAMLVLSGRYPNLMREVLADISILYEQNLDETNTSRPLKVCFAEPLQHLEQIKDPYVSREYKQFRHDFNRLIPDLTLETLGEENFQLALSFCFVGDIGYDPEDYRLSETASNDNGNYPSDETTLNKYQTTSSDSLSPDEA